jgi:DNA-directed RNA polymerase specialized sigma24 family protein
MISDREFTDIWTEAQPGLRSYALWLSRNPLLVDDLVQQTALQAESPRMCRDPARRSDGQYTILRKSRASMTL